MPATRRRLLTMTARIVALLLEACGASLNSQQARGAAAIAHYV